MSRRNVIWVTTSRSSRRRFPDRRLEIVNPIIDAPDGAAPLASEGLWASVRAVARQRGQRNSAVDASAPLAGVLARTKTLGVSFHSAPTRWIAPSAAASVCGETARFKAGWRKCETASSASMVNPARCSSLGHPRRVEVEVQRRKLVRFGREGRPGLLAAGIAGERLQVAFVGVLQRVGAPASQHGCDLSQGRRDILEVMQDADRHDGVTDCWGKRQVI